MINYLSPLSVLLAVLVGCQLAEHDESSEAGVDPWFNCPELKCFTMVDDTEVTSVWEVAASKLEYAEGLLEAQPIISLDPSVFGLEGWTEESAIAAALGISGAVAEPGEQLFLVRGLYRIGASGRFSVWLEKDELLVNHQCLSHGYAPMHRSAVVVSLPERPKAVFIRCAIAE